MVRLPKELGDIIEDMSKKFRVLPYSLRNTAILYGLYVIAISKRVPQSDEEFEYLLKKLREIAYEGEVHTQTQERNQ